MPEGKRLKPCYWHEINTSEPNPCNLQEYCVEDHCFVILSELQPNHTLEFDAVVGEFELCCVRDRDCNVVQCWGG